MVRFVTLGRIVPTTAAAARSFAKSAHAATGAIFIAMTAHRRCEHSEREKPINVTDQQTMAKVFAAAKVGDGTENAVATP
jgi:hypothetical protein